MSPSQHIRTACQTQSSLSGFDLWVRAAFIQLLCF